MGKRYLWIRTVVTGMCAGPYLAAGQAGGEQGPPTTPAFTFSRAQDTPLSVNDLKLVSQQNPAEPTSSSVETQSSSDCAANAFQVPGQAWTAGLTEGGITLHAERYPASPPAFDTLFPKSPDQATASASATSSIPGGARNIVLAVADHHEPTDILLKEFGNPQTTVPMRHGHLVVAHLRTILESAGFRSSERNYLEYRRGGLTITILPLDIPPLKAATLLKNKSAYGHSPGQEVYLRDIQNFLSRSLAPVGDKSGQKAAPTQFRDTVITMSFSILNCRILNDYRTMRDRRASANPPKLYTFQQYLDELAALNRIEESEMRGLLTEVPKETQFMKWLDKQAEPIRRSRRVIFAASSGNFGLRFPTAPGAHRNVISVGATDWKGNRAAWSSTADVTSVGEWFSLSPSAPDTLGI